MANQLKMALVEAILTLHQRGWSHRRIARELGIHRQTVARQLQLAGATATPAVAPRGPEAPPPAPNPPIAPLGSAAEPPAANPAMAPLGPDPAELPPKPGPAPASVADSTTATPASTLHAG